MSRNKTIIKYCKEKYFNRISKIMLLHSISVSTSVKSINCYIALRRVISSFAEIVAKNIVNFMQSMMRVYEYEAVCRSNYSCEL